MGTPLPIAVKQLLKTPTAQLAVNGGSQDPAKRREGGHGPTLADQVEHELLPTPQAGDGNGSGRAGERLLPGIAKTLTGGGELLPTPAARDFRSGKSNIMDRNSRPLSEVIETELLASTGGSTNPPSGDGKLSSEDPRQTQLSLEEQDQDCPPPLLSGCKGYQKAG